LRESRIDVLRKCENALRAEFYYALAFERDDGFYIEAHPNAAARCLLALDASQQKEMTTSLFTIADVLAEKAKNHRKAQ